MFDNLPLSQYKVPFSLLTSIGYGLAAPRTTDGKIFLIFFGLIGCAAAILLFNLFLEGVITLITYVLSRCHEKKLQNSRQRAATFHHTTQPGGTASGQEGWKPSVYYVTLIMVAVCFLVACAASGLYSAVEGWSYLESMYFCLVTFSTMGFGDMVSGQQEPYEASWFYQITNTLVIFFGVGCTYCLLNLIAVMIKAMLNWILGKALCLNGCSWTGSWKHQFIQLCCSCFVCPKVETYPRNLPIASSCFNQHWSCHVVKLRTGECKCSGSALQTVCQSEMHAMKKKVICEHKLSKDNVNLFHVVGDCPLCQHNGLSEMMGDVAMLSNHLQEKNLNS